MKAKSQDWGILILTTLLLISGLIGALFDIFSLLSISATVINIFFIFKFYRTIPLFLLFVFVFLYTRTFNYFLIDNVDISFWSDFQTKPIINKVLINHTTFMFFLGNLIPSNIGIKVMDFNAYFKFNKSVFFSLLLVGVLILIFGLSGETLLERARYNDLESVEKSTLHEYFILIYLFIFIFSPKGKFYDYTLKVLIGIYAIKTILYGGRIEVIQITFLFLYLKYVFKKKIKPYYIVILVLFGFYFINIISNIRSRPQDFLQGNVGEVFSLTNIFITNKDVSYISSNEGDVIQSSARMVGLVETYNISTQQRLYSFLCYLASPLVPASIMPDYANLATFKQDSYGSGGGGLISTYFFVWLGYSGPIIIALIISMLIKYFYKFQNKGLIVYGICLLCTFPRWFAYNPIFLVKFCLYAVILLHVIDLYKKILSVNLKKNIEQ